MITANVTKASEHHGIQQNNAYFSPKTAMIFYPKKHRVLAIRAWTYDYKSTLL